MSQDKRSLMLDFSDEVVTRAIQRRLGLVGVQRLQQELVEGLRNGSPHGYPSLRVLLEALVDEIGDSE
jgi:hypothetical protein